MTSTASPLNGAVALLIGTNTTCAVIGATQGLLVLRMLGPEFFGAAAVLVALTSVATNFVDVRVTDLIARLYYREGTSNAALDPEYRSAVLGFGFRLYLAGAALIAIVSLGAIWFGAPRLTGVDLAPSWFWIAAAAQGINYLGSFFIFIQRFVAPPRRIAALQLASTLINAAAMLTAVSATPTVGGYVAGLLASATGIAALNAWQTIAILRQDGIALYGPRSVSAPVCDRRELIRFVAAGNALGYVKLLHRSADVLLVAAFCSDRATGVYRLARSIADSLLIVSEAIGRVYQPRLLSLLQSRKHLEYAAATWSLASAAAGVTVAAVIVELLVLPRIAPVFGITEARDLTLTVAILTLSFFFVAGLQSWIWPAFVHSGRLGRCAFWSAIGVLGGQYSVGPLLVYSTGDANPAWFAVSYLSYYALSTIPLWRELRSEQLTPSWRARLAAS
jgi:O-antigen/teichoic acid export membrane protein